MNNHQMMLFTLIQKTLPQNLILVNVVSELLNISYDAAYRRIRGDKPISLEEAITLCNHFNISLDSLAKATDEKNIQCQYSPIDLSDLSSYIAYLQELAGSIESARMAPDGEIIFTAVDIPIFNYSAFKEMAFFKLFAWSNSVNSFTGNYDEFVKRLDIPKLSNSFDKIVKNYLLCPSTEVWTDNTIDQIIRLLYHHYEMGHLGNEDFPLLICGELWELINTYHQWTETGCKGSSETPFKFYVSDVDLSNTYVLYRKNETINCDLKLFTINHFDIFDQRFCHEMETWLNTAIQRSTLITGAAEKYRYKFFSEQRQKIIYLVNKILANADRGRVEYDDIGRRPLSDYIIW